MKTDTHSIPPEQILDTLPQVIFAVDHGLCITYCNKTAEVLAGISKPFVLGKLYSDVFQVTFALDDCPLLASMESGQSFSDIRGILLSTAKQQIKVKITTAILRGAQNSITGCIAMLQPEGVVASDYSSMQCAVQACEVQSIMTALRRNNNNRTAAARDLGIHKSTFFRKIKKMGIDLPHMDGRFRH